MFEGLIDRFQQIKRKLIGYGRITNTELESILKEIKIVLLEADVNYKIVKKFIEQLRTKCQKLELAKSLKPGEIVIKTVYEALIELLGKTRQKIEFQKNKVTVVVLVGLQGTGKTTTAVKLGVRFNHKSPLLVPADAKRPAAYEQLAQLAKRAGLPVFPLEEKDVIKTVKKAKASALKNENGLMIIDTAGRLHIDRALIDELKAINRALIPDYCLLVADGMSGQDAVNQAQAFQEQLDLDGAILTKMDGDARGGAALSITQVAQVPIFYLGNGEELNGIEEFYPERVAQRIMGMGDLASLVEKVKVVEKGLDKQKLRKKLTTGSLNLEDFLEQLKAVKKLGPLSKLAAMIPGVKETDVNENEFKKIEAIINSMTQQERLNPEIIDGARKKRIAAGSGTTLQDVNQLLKQFKFARDMLKKMRKGRMPGNLPFRP